MQEGTAWALWDGSISSIINIVIGRSRGGPRIVELLLPSRLQLIAR